MRIPIKELQLVFDGGLVQIVYINGMRRMALLFSFYRLFLPAGWGISICCIFILRHLFPSYGWSPFFYLFWFKVLSLALIYYVIDYRQKQLYYYYFNLGFSKRRLWAASLTVDMGLFLGLLFVLKPGN